MAAKFTLQNRAFFLLILALTSLCVLTVFVVSPGIDGYEKARFGEMVYGKAYKPFVYRQLLPLMVRGLVWLYPDNTATWLRTVIESISMVQAKFDRSDWARALYPELITACLLMWLALIGFAYALIYLLRTFYRTSLAVERSVVLLAVGILPAFFDKCNYIYDFPLLFLFTLGLAFLARRKMWWFSLVFVLGCVNKETTILLTLIFLIDCASDAQFGKMKYYLWLLFQAAAFFIIKIALFFAYRDNAGGTVEIHLMDYNLGMVGTVGLETVIAIAAVGLAVFHDWRMKPRFLRRSLWIAIPLFVLTMLFGYIDEQRDFYELYPLILLLMLPSILRLLKIAYRPV